jgi:hypothetical protein
MGGALCGFDDFFNNTFATASYPQGPVVYETLSSPSALSAMLVKPPSRVVRACYSDSDVKVWQIIVLLETLIWDS